MSLAVALATRVNRSNKFICRPVLLAVLGTRTRLLQDKLWRRVPRNALLGAKAMVDDATRAHVTAILALINPTIFLMEERRLGDGAT